MTYECQFARVARPFRQLLILVVCLASILASTPALLAADDADLTGVGMPKKLVLIVMDPLAKPLSCPCVQGYAQRDYGLLGKSLSTSLQCPVEVVFGESIAACMKKEESSGVAHLIIGKQSVVLYDAPRAKVTVRSVARLANKEGGTTMTGLVVVPTSDPAQSIADLSDYRIVFGPEECAEKHEAALKLLSAAGVAAPTDLETSPACDEGAISILEGAKTGERGAAVISSYAKPLLEGCGTVEKGSLRVVGETEPVPFIEAFVTDQLNPSQQARVASALFQATKDAELRTALETRDGFISAIEPVAPAENKAAANEVKKKSR